MPTLSFSPLEIASCLLAVVSVLALVLSMRAALLRKWALILDSPASCVSRKQRWFKKLPEGLDLSKEEPLFEVLYAHFKSFTHRPSASALGIAMETAGERPALPIAQGAVRGARLSGEEKITMLMGAEPDPSGLVPTEALAHNLVLHLFDVLKGKKKLSMGVEHALLDSLGAGGGIAGAKLGGAVGLALAPLLAGMAATLLPVWAILGAFLGAMAGKKMGGHFKGRRYHAILKKRRSLARQFKKWFLSQFPEFLDERELNFRKTLRTCRELKRKNQSMFARWLLPDIMTAFFTACSERIEVDRSLERSQLQKLKVQIKSVPAENLVSLLEKMDENAARTNEKLSEFLVAYRSLSKEMDELARAEPTHPAA